MKGSIMMDLGGNNMALQKKGMHGAWAGLLYTSDAADDP